MISPKSSKLYLTLLSSWLSRESLKMKELFFLRVCPPTEESWSQAFLAETVETGDKNCDLTDNIFRAPCVLSEKSLGKINTKDVELLRNGSVHEF